MNQTLREWISFTARILGKPQSFDVISTHEHAFLDINFIMKIVYLFIASCILGDGSRISHYPRIFKYRKNISLSQGYLNIGFRNEKDIMLSERYNWAKTIKTMGMARPNAEPSPTIMMFLRYSIISSD